MGAWGFGAFENDSAQHWIGDLEEVDNLTMIDQTLQAVINTPVPPETDCCEALAAAEVVAALHKAPSPTLAEEAASWIKKNPNLTDALREKALEAVTVILSDSELRDVWVEEDDLEVWKEELEDLILRLK
jgi:hypothetical protein